MLSERSKLKVFLVFLLAALALGGGLVLSLSRGEDLRTVRWANHSVEVPAEWPQRNLFQWCRSDGETPTWSVPGPTTLVGCEPRTGYGAAFVAKREASELQQRTDDEFPDGAWVVVENFEDMPNWSLLIVGRSQDEAAALLASAR